MEFYKPLPGADIAQQRIAEFIMSVMTLVDRVVAEAVNRNVLESAELYEDDDDRGRSYGYTIGLGKRSNGEELEGWLGLYFDVWRRYGQSPIWLQFYEEDQRVDRAKATTEAERSGTFLLHLNGQIFATRDAGVFRIGLDGGEVTKILQTLF